MNNDNFTLDKNTRILTWKINKKINSIENVDQFRIYDNMIIFIVSDLTKIKGVLENGETVFESHAPSGFKFSYLTTHPESKMAVVCSSEIQVSGWNDWIFSISNVGLGGKMSPAY